MQKSKSDLKIMKFINEHKKMICIIIAVAYTVLMGIIAYFVGLDNFGLEILYYVSQIISGVFVIMGVAVAVIQYTYNSNEKRIEDEKQKRIEGAKMADEFRKTVIPLINKLSKAYSNENLRKNIVDYLNEADLTDFDINEMNRLFPEDLYVKYRVQVALNYGYETNEKLKEMLRGDLKELDSEQKKVVDDIMMNEMYEVGKLCTELSNILEHMCICFNAEIADDLTVYQSLHKVFFQGVHMIYIFTFDGNANEYDRLYYNIMILYKKWKTMYKEKRLQEQAAQEKLKEEYKNMSKKYKEKITVTAKINK